MMELKIIIKEFFKSKAFLVSIFLLLVYSIFFNNQVVLNQTNLEYIYSLFLALLPLIIAIFTILI